MGGGTDQDRRPSGKDESRKLLHRRADRRQHRLDPHRVRAFLAFGDGPTDAVMVNNADWLDTLGYVELLRDVGRTSRSTAC
jgi:tyrosyl-tRNA synthetase